MAKLPLYGDVQVVKSIIYRKIELYFKSSNSKPNILQIYALLVIYFHKYFQIVFNGNSRCTGKDSADIG